MIPTRSQKKPSERLLAQFVLWQQDREAYYHALLEALANEVPE